jgi:hypothetical protein
VPRPAAARLAKFHRLAAHRWRTRHAHAVRERLAESREPNPVASRLTGPVPLTGRSED